LATKRVQPSKPDAQSREGIVVDESEEETGEVRFTPPPLVWKYLKWLSRHTLLGKDEREVARQVLITKLAEMRQEDYRDPAKT
jgi:hypothetical protein